MDDLDPTTALASFNPSSTPPQEDDISPSEALKAYAPRVDPAEALKSLDNAKPPSVDEAKLGAAADYYRQHAEETWGPGSKDYEEARIPGVGLGRVLGKAYDLSGSLDRYKKGTHSDTDLFNIAEAQAKQEYQADRAKDFGNRAFDFATHAPGLIAEFAASGGITSAIGKGVAARLGGSLAARAAGFGAQTAAMTALTPSMYLEQATGANVQQGRDPLDPRGLAPAYGLAAAQMAVLGAVSEFAPKGVEKLTGISFKGDGALQAVGRVGTQAATGPFAQAAADLVTSGFDTNYGTVGKFKHGDIKGAFEEAAMDAMQFAVFGTAHEISHGGKGPGEAEAKDNPVMKAFVDAANDLHSQGVLKDEAGKILQGPADIIAAIHAKDPNASRQTIEVAMQRLPEGPLRTLGMQMAAQIPTHMEAQGPNPGIDELPVSKWKNRELAIQRDLDRIGPANDAWHAAARVQIAADGKANTVVGTVKDFMSHGGPTGSELTKVAGHVPVIVGDVPSDDLVGQRRVATEVFHEDWTHPLIVLDRDSVKGMGARKLTSIVAHEAAHAARHIKGRKTDNAVEYDRRPHEESASRAQESVYKAMPEEVPGSDQESQGPTPGIDELPPEAQQPPKTVAPSPPEAVQQPSTPETPQHPVGKAFEEAFPGARQTSHPDEPVTRWKAEFGNREIYARHDPETNKVRLDFGWKEGSEPEGVAKSGPKANVPAGIQPGSKDMFRKIFGEFASKLKESGTGIEYTATDSRAGTYRRMLEKAGFEQDKPPEEVSKGSGSSVYSWKPKGVAANEAIVKELGQDTTPEVRLDNLFNAAKLTTKQKHILYERATNPDKTHQQIGEGLGLTGDSVRQNIQKSEKDARKKIEKLTGQPFDSTYDAIIKADAASAAQDAKEGATPGKQGLVAEAIEGAGRTQDPEARFHDTWVKSLEAIRNSSEYKDATQAEKKAIDEEWASRYQTSVQNRDSWLKEVRKLKKSEAYKAGDKDDRERLFDDLAQRFQSESGANTGSVAQTPVRSEAPVDVQPRSAQRPADAAPKDEGSQVLGTGVDAGKSGAPGDKLTGIPPATLARMKEMVKAGDKIGLDDIREALEATRRYSDADIRQARKDAGRIAKGVEQPKQASAIGSYETRDRGGLRKDEAGEQLSREIEAHEMHGGEEPANQEMEVAPGVFFHRGETKLLAPEEHANVVQDVKRAGYPESEAEGLIKQVENEVARQLQEEIRATRSGPEGVGAAQQAQAGQAPSGPVGPGGQPNGPGDTRVQLAPNVFYHSPSGRGSGAGGVTASLTTPLGAKPPLAGAAAGGIMKNIIRNRNAEMHRKMEISAETLNRGARFFDVWTEAAPDPATRESRFLDFTNAMEHDKIDTLPPEIQEFARMARDIIQTHEDELKRKGYLSTFVDHYMGHLWEDPNNPNATAEEISARINSKRSLAGGETYRKQRSMPTYQDGIEAGLVPRSWNPIDLVKMKADEVDKSIAGRDTFNEAKKQGLLRYQTLGAKTQAGWRMLNDKLARVLAPPETKVTEYFDKQQMEGLEKFASSLGIDMDRVTKGLGRAAGQTEVGGPGPDKVTTKFGTPEEILAHEVGHVLDKRYGMSSWLRDPVVSNELTDLADLRSSGPRSQDYKDYIRSDPERMANLVAAYLHAPELLNRVAPNAMAHLESLMASHKELQPLRDIKPSLELGQREQMQRVAGPMLTGNYYGPNEVIDAIEKHLSPGLGGNKVFQAFRGFGNALNMMQLGWSAYHYTATALNAQMSAAALGFKMLSRGDVSEAAKQLPKALIPLYAPIEAVRKGLEMRKDYFAPGSGSPETQMLNQAWEQGGGRARMDQMYRGSQLEAFQKAFDQFKAGQSGKILGVVGRMLPALNEAVSLPLMEHFVPLVKNGVGADMVKYEMSKLPPGATVNEKRAVYAKVVDSIDNRFGQMIYDNLFWNRTLKDSLMTAFRSVGWNLGTGRELGGGLKDVPESLKGLQSGEGISHRLAYIGGMTAVTAMYGAMIQYMYTGKGPDEAKDFFFPKTGQKNPDGSAERKSLPVYMKDVYGLTNRADEGPVRVARNAWGMAKSKLHPAVIAAMEMMNNEDFHGKAIDNPNDPILTRTKDDLAHFLKAFEPFSMRGFHEQGAAGGAEQFMGITKAPQYITKTSQEQRAAETSRKVVVTPLAKKAKADKGK